MPISTQSYDAALNYMYAQLPMFHRIGVQAYKKDLINTLALCAAMGNPHQQIKTIHIAGTNGKGSVSHMIAAVLQAHGYKVGLYISPHYKDFRERIKINGKYIPRRNVLQFVEQHKELVERIKPSFFEMTVAMAFDYFAKEEVDYAVIETGLGGRLDSTNVITPLLSVITNIAWDHTDLLGDTLQQIAKEKAGIIKPHVPIVIGRKQAETTDVFIQSAKENKSELIFAEQLVEIKSDMYAGEINNLEIHAKKHVLECTFTPDLKGVYQNENYRTAIAASLVFFQSQMLPFNINLFKDALEHVTSLTNIIGRWQYIREAKPPILCDSAHNEDGIRMLFEAVSKKSFNKLHIICGFVKNKPLEKVLELMPKDAHYYFAKANIPRGLESNLLQIEASNFNLKGRPYKSVRKALAAAKKSAQQDDFILVCGSIFVVAEVL